MPYVSQILFFSSYNLSDGDLHDHSIDRVPHETFRNVPQWIIGSSQLHGFRWISLTICLEKNLGIVFWKTVFYWKYYSYPSPCPCPECGNQSYWLERWPHLSLRGCLTTDLWCGWITHAKRHQLMCTCSTAVCCQGTKITCVIHKFMIAFP